MAVAKSNSIPEEYRPLSAWAYFGYNLLYSIPVVGWIFMVIFALDGSNINRRNFTRSFFIVYLVAAVVITVLLWTGLLLTMVQGLTGN